MLVAKAGWRQQQGDFVSEPGSADSENACADLLNTVEAARFLRLSQRTLERHREKKTGPAYVKFGVLVFYDPDDLRSWAESSKRSPSRRVGSAEICSITQVRSR